MNRRALVTVVPVLVAACAPAGPSPSHLPQTVIGTAPASPDAGDTLPPAGFGTLRQDEFSVEIVANEVHMKMTPLAEEVIRLAAPDTYERLSALARSRLEEAVVAADGRGVELFLVSFFSREPNAEYRPDDLQLSHRGRLQRPAVILPLTTGWGRQLLQPQQTQSAIYGFEAPFDYEQPMTVRYGLRQSEEWHQTVQPRLEDERLRVHSRAGSRTGG